MTMPHPGQTVHMMTKRDVVRKMWGLRRKEGRNWHELKLYTTDDLRHLYQETKEESIRLRDGYVDRSQLVAVIRWRIFLEEFRYVVLLAVSLASACFAFLAWRDPLPPPTSLNIAAPVQTGPTSK
jgi:hypothetical protein